MLHRICHVILTKQVGILLLVEGKEEVGDASQTEKIRVHTATTRGFRDLWSSELEVGDHSYRIEPTIGVGSKLGVLLCSQLSSEVEATHLDLPFLGHVQVFRRNTTVNHLCVLVHKVKSFKQLEQQYLNLQNRWNLVSQVLRAFSQTRKTVLHGLSDEDHVLVILLWCLNQVEHTWVLQLGEIHGISLEHAESLVLHAWVDSVDVRFLRFPAFLFEHENANLGFLSSSAVGSVNTPELVETCFHEWFLFLLVILGELGAHDGFYLSLDSAKYVFHFYLKVKLMVKSEKS
jgi:hypothetical protein